MESIKEQFDKYQYKRNSYIARNAAKIEIMCLLPDKHVEPLLNLMTQIYDFAYNQALNDCIALNNLEFPTSED